MRVVERHIIKDNRYEDLCRRSGLLYNFTLYNVKQGIRAGQYLKEYEFSTKLCRENQFDFRNLPTSISQRVISQVFSLVKSWVRLKKDFEKNPGKYNNREPKFPKYKDGKKQNMIVFTNSACRIKDGYIYFVKNITEPIKTNVKPEELKQVRIIPQATCYVVEVIYEMGEQDLNLDKSRVLSIDLGLNNFCACISNVGERPFIINGRVMKSFNQWYNKTRAKWMEFVGGKGTSKRLRWLNNRRNFWIEDKLHKISRLIIDYCIEHNIGTIVIGLNKGWKQNIDLGKKTNQKFVELPHSRLIEKITYKGRLVGIDARITEESYTSKVDHLAFETLDKHDIYLGKRKKRGLFQSSVCKLLNADINGAIGIGRKVFGDSYVREIIGSGFAFNPVRVNIL